jgi:hypothetical protein
MRHLTEINRELCIWLALVYLLKCVYFLYSIFTSLDLKNGPDKWKNSCWTCKVNRSDIDPESVEKCRDVQNEPISG